MKLSTILSAVLVAALPLLAAVQAGAADTNQVLHIEGPATMRPSTNQVVFSITRKSTTLLDIDEGGMVMFNYKAFAEALERVEELEAEVKALRAEVEKLKADAVVIEWPKPIYFTLPIGTSTWEIITENTNLVWETP